MFRKLKRNGVYFTQRTISEQMQLHVPKAKLHQFAEKHRYGNLGLLKAKHRYDLTVLSEVEIVLTYNAELRGLANYYSIATSAKIEMHKLFRLALVSFFKTMALKRGKSVTQVAHALKWDGGFAVQGVNSNREQRHYKLFQLKDLELKPPDYNLDIIQEPTMYTHSKTELLQRLSANVCEYCGKEGGYFEVHHVRKLKDIQKGNLLWERLMMWRRRKTLVLCISCHRKLHAGTLPSSIRKPVK